MGDSKGRVKRVRRKPNWLATLGVAFCVLATLHLSRSFLQKTETVHTHTRILSAEENGSDAGTSDHKAASDPRDRPLTWLPGGTLSGICVYTVAVNSATSLARGIVHNANWAVAHDSSFTVFHKRMTAKHPTWEKVEGARRLIEKEECRWVVHIDADAVVVNVGVSPQAMLERMEAEADSPLVFAACNSPIGSDLDCDRFCCGRAKSLREKASCPVKLRDEGPAAPFPCLINSGVFFMRNVPDSRVLLRKWLSKQTEAAEDDPYFEQEALNMIKEAHPEWIEVVGAQVMNTPASFHKRMLNASDPAVAFDIALRVSTGYEPKIQDNERLNQSLYAEVAEEVFGSKLGSPELQRSLVESPGECIHDDTAVICHAFARDLEWKTKMVVDVASREKGSLQGLLHEKGYEYRGLSDVLGRGSHGEASKRGKMKSEAQRGGDDCHDSPSVHHLRYEIGEMQRRIEEQKTTIQSFHNPYQQSTVPPRFGGIGTVTTTTMMTPAAIANSDIPVENTIDTNLTAVCIAGALRTFLQPEVQKSFVEMLHHPGYEYFVVTDVPWPEEEDAMKLAIRPIRAWVHGGVQGEIDSGRPIGPREDELWRCPNATCNSHRYLYSAIAPRLVECYRAIQREEGRRGVRYATVFKIRPDHIVTRRIAPIGPTIAYAHPARTVHIYDDQMALARREDAASIFLAPTVAYTSCADQIQWRLACGDIGKDHVPMERFDRCVTHREEPCEPMRLIIPFGTAEHVLGLPWNPRQWVPGQEGPAVPGDWCLKRPLFTVDDERSTCRDESGCMAC